MKKTLLLSGVLLALTASVASAGGINLAWTDCLSGAGTVNKAFACNINTGNHDLHISVIPDINMPDVNGTNPIIDLQSDQALLPAWWQFKNVGTCRLTSLSSQLGLGTCPDTWAGQGIGTIAAYYVTANTPAMPVNRARILGSVAVSGAFAVALDNVTETLVQVVRINSTKTVGTGLCAGCSFPVCLVLNEVLLTSNTLPDTRLIAPLVSNYATWQGTFPGAGGCPGATPTINKTWGQVKSLYR